MDQETDSPINAGDAAESAARRRRAFRGGKLLRYGAGGLACAACGGAVACYFSAACGPATAAEVFKDDAPSGRLWQQWQDRGWVKEARHYLKLGREHPVQALPQRVPAGAGGPRPLPQPRPQGRQALHAGLRQSLRVPRRSRSRRSRCSISSPARASSPFAATGCGFRCLNCQNWNISQRKPEELKDPRGESVPHRRPQHEPLSRGRRSTGMSMFPDDMVALAEYFDCPLDRLHLFRADGVVRVHDRHGQGGPGARTSKNVLVTCGYIQQEPLASCAGTSTASTWT